MITTEQKQQITKQLIDCFTGNDEITRIVIFGSFLNSDNPADLDVAIFQNSQLPYLTLALKYRRLARKISEQIPLDIIPLHANMPTDPFLDTIAQGETIYER